VGVRYVPDVWGHFMNMSVCEREILEGEEIHVKAWRNQAI